MWEVDAQCFLAVEMIRLLVSRCSGQGRVNELKLVKVKFDLSPK